jgi:hypothetical protein
VTSSLEQLIRYNFRNSINSRQWKIAQSVSAGVGVTNGQASLLALGSTDNWAAVTSIKPCLNSSGQEVVVNYSIRTSVSPDSTATDSYSVWGLMDRADTPTATTLPRNMIVFGHNAVSGFFVAIKRDDDTPSAFSTLYAAQSSWNGESLGITLDATKINNYQISLVTLDCSDVHWRIYDPSKGRHVTVHTYSHSNLSTTGLVENNNLCAGFAIQNNSSSSSAVNLQCSAVDCGVRGMSKVTFPLRALRINTGNISQGVYFWVVKCKDTFLGKANHSGFFLTTMHQCIENNSTYAGSIQVFTGSEFSVAPTFTDVDSNTSIVETATGANVGTVSNEGDLIYNSVASHKKPIAHNLAPKLYVEANGLLLFKCTLFESTTSSIEISIKIQEDI